MAEPDQRRGEDADADGDPDRLPAPVVGVEPVVRRHAERGQYRGEREQRAVGVRDRAPDDDVCDDVEAEEERSPGDDVRRELRVARERDAASATLAMRPARTSPKSSRRRAFTD